MSDLNGDNNGSVTCVLDGIENAASARPKPTGLSTLETPGDPVRLVARESFRLLFSLGERQEASEKKETKTRSKTREEDAVS